MAAEALQEPLGVEGEVADIDRSVARVLIGDAEEEWFFPMSLLPDGVETGTVLQFTFENGRYTPTGASRVDGLAAIEHRLSRPLSSRRTDQTTVSELRARLND